MLLETDGSTKKSKGKSKIAWDQWQWKHNYPKSWETTKAVLRGKSTAAQAFLKMKKNLKLTAQPKKLEQEPTKSTVNKEGNHKDQRGSQ